MADNSRRKSKGRESKGKAAAAASNSKGNAGTSRRSEKIEYSSDVTIHNSDMNEISSHTADMSDYTHRANLPREEGISPGWHTLAWDAEEAGRDQREVFASSTSTEPTE